MKIIKSALLSCLAVLLSACGTTPTYDLPQQLAPRPDQEKAYLIGTIGADISRKVRTLDDRNDGNYLYFRSIGGKESAAIQFSESDFYPTPLDFQEAHSKGATFAIALPPGNYEFYNVRFYFNNGRVEKEVTAKQDFSIPFTLKAGRVLYVGELLAYLGHAKNFFGITIPYGGYFIRTNQSERDIALITRKHNVIQNLPVDLLSFDQVAPPFILESIPR
jgi:hypothetical protein